MKLVAEIVAGIAIYAFGGWAAWWVNHRVDLTALPSRLTRYSLKVFIALIVFVATTAPLVYGLRALFR